MQRWERIAQRIEEATTPTRRYTKGEIALRLHISRPALDRRLAGSPAWEYDKLEALAALLGVTVEELVGDTSDQEDDGAA